MRLSLTSLFIILFSILPGSKSILAQETELSRSDWTLKKLNVTAFKCYKTFPDSALSLALFGLEWAEELGDSTMISNFNMRLGNAYRIKAKYKEALKNYRESLTIESYEGNPYGIGRANLAIATVFMDQQNFPEAVKHSDIAFEEFSKVPEKVVPLIKTLGERGTAYANLGNIEKGFANLVQAQKIIDSNGAKVGPTLQAEIYSRFGSIYGMLNLNRVAINYYKKSLDAFSKSQSLLSTTLTNIGNCYFQLNKPDSALLYYNQSLALGNEGNNKINLIKLHQNIGSAFIDQDKYEEAEIALKTSQKLSEGLPKYEGKAEILYSLSIIEFTKKNFNKALQLANSSYQIARDHRMPQLLEKTNDFIYDILIYKEQYRKAHERIKLHKNLRDSLRQDLGEDIDFAYLNELSLLNENLDSKFAIYKAESKFFQNIIIIVVGLLILLVGYAIYQGIRNRTNLILAAKEQDRKVNHAMIMAEDRAKNRISRELHDGISSLLTGFKLQFDAIRRDLEVIGSTKLQDAKEASDVLKKAMKEIRLVSHELSNYELHTQTLSKSIDTLVKSFNVNQEGAMQFSTSLDIDHLEITDILKFHTFRIIQELVVNAVKHSNAQEVFIQVFSESSKEETFLKVIVEDDGKGMENPEGNLGNGIGFQNINTRLAPLNGKIEIDSAMGKGTSIIIEIPIQ
ncbi:MAG: tetratricopeptide repeat protein [Bacteroidia bacterium]|nr:tetratricopeptide repeat protein [Bacteroidia bacterium]